jgi:hypothetical protein
MAIVRPKPTTTSPSSQTTASSAESAGKPTPPRRRIPDALLKLDTDEASPIIPMPEVMDREHVNRKTAEVIKRVLEEPKRETPKAEEPKERKKQEATKPTIPAGEPDSAELGCTDSGTDEHDEAEGQVNLIQLHKLDVMARHALWKKLNRGTKDNQFVTVLSRESLPKKVAREEPAGKAPAVRNVLWCCYCGDWNVFEHFAYVGSQKCVGCGISTKDYHNRSANNLWKVDL